jgi:hypothetical protein
MISDRHGGLGEGDATILAPRLSSVNLSRNAMILRTLRSPVCAVAAMPSLLIPSGFPASPSAVGHEMAAPQPLATGHPTTLRRNATSH